LKGTSTVAVAVVVVVVVVVVGGGGGVVDEDIRMAPQGTTVTTRAKDVSCLTASKRSLPPKAPSSSSSSS